MWVGIFFCRAAVPRPARVPDAIRAFDGRFGNGFFQVTQLACSAADFQLAVLGNYGYTGGVITAIFEFPQALDNHRNDLFRSDITNNAAHARGSYRYFKVNMREKCQTKY